MKLKDLSLLVMFVALVGVGIYYDAKVSKLEKQLAKTTVDTLKITLQIRDTLFVTVADTVFERADTFMVGDTVFVQHWPVMVDRVSQPLFDLRVNVDTKTRLFGYDFEYKPLHVKLEFFDKFDLRKGCKVSVLPAIGDVSIDWGDYKPQKKSFGIFGAIGLGYSRSFGAFVLGELSVKGVQVGALIHDGGYGVYVKKVVFNF